MSLAFFNRIKNLSRRLLEASKCCSMATAAPVPLITYQHMLDPSIISKEQLIMLLWTAHEIKKFDQHKMKIDVVKGKNATLLMSIPCHYMKTTARTAARLLSLNLDCIVSPEWEEFLYISEFARYLSYNADVIICFSNHHLKLEQLAKGCTTPLITLQTCRFTNIEVLAHLMTIQEHFGYLKNLTLACIGYPSQLINTYLLLLPKLCMNITYHCNSRANELLSPVFLQKAKESCVYQEAKIIEGVEVPETVKNADVIVVMDYGEENYKLVQEHLHKAHPNWKLIHPFHKGHQKIDERLFNVKNNITIDCYRNLSYVFSSLILSTLINYEHLTPMPQFFSNNDLAKA